MLLHIPDGEKTAIFHFVEQQSSRLLLEGASIKYLYYSLYVCIPFPKIRRSELESR